MTDAQGSHRSLSEIADALLSKARAAGADLADVLASRSESVSVSARSGALEGAERSETVDFGLRVLIDAKGGRRQATVSASDSSDATLSLLAERAVAMAREAPLDADVQMAPAELFAAETPELDLCDPSEPPSPEALLEAARALEAEALAVDGVTRAEGAEIGWSRAAVHLATSIGFSRGYDSTSHGLSVAAIAGEGLGMERDYAYSSARHRADLKSIEEVGREAGERAVRSLSPRKPTSGAYPIILEPRLASGVVGSLLGALNGESIARGSSFLKDKMGERILPAGMALIDTPLRKRGLGSRPFDGEGLAGQENRLIDDGIVASWLLDLSTAHRLGLTSNAMARRGVASPPGPGASNAWLTAGERTPEELIGEIKQGLFVTQMMGRGVNMVTGDYSRGASGFWIENGEIAYPVSELTVAGRITDMLAGLEAANDLTFERRIDSPTLRIEGLTLAAG